jgi:hypothetical protein
MIALGLVFVGAACQRTITSGSHDFLIIGASKQETLAAAREAGISGVYPLAPRGRFVDFAIAGDADVINSYILKYDVWEFPVPSGYGQYRVYFDDSGELTKVEHASSPVELP